MTYIGIVVVFAVPLVALQWLLGWRILLLEWRPIAVVVVMTTIYFGCTDFAGLNSGIWAINHLKSFHADTRLFVIEDWLFLLATNLLIAQTVTLALDVDVREKVRELFDKATRK